VAAKLTLALVFPTPPSTYALQSTERSALTVHEGEPEVRCELPGAFAELKLPASGPYVPGTTAHAAAAKRAISSIGKPPMIPTLLILLIDSPVLDAQISRRHSRSPFCGEGLGAHAVKYHVLATAELPRRR
jgi:hypothetical protein